MSEKLMLDVDQAGELKAAFRRNGWTNKDIKRLSEGSLLAEVLDVLRGRSKVEPIKYIIDCDASPTLSPGMPAGFWVAKRHWRGGKVDWSRMGECSVYFVDQNTEAGMAGWQIMDKTEGEQGRAMNANVLDYLMKHPQLIPSGWRDHKAIYFWGTIYRHIEWTDRTDSWAVRYIKYDGKKWVEGFDMIDRQFSKEEVAAFSGVEVFTSQS